MHAIIIFLYYLSKLLNLTLNFESLSSRFLNKLVLLAFGCCPWLSGRVKYTVICFGMDCFEVVAGCLIFGVLCCLAWEQH